MKLTEKQRRFADEYIRTGNIYQSAILAGYSKNSAASTGHENLKKPNIKAYLDKRLDKLKKQSIAEQDEILQFLTSVLRGEEEGRLKVGIGGGAEEVVNEKPSLQERIKAAEQLGKRYAMWTDKQEITQRTIDITLGDYDDED